MIILISKHKLQQSEKNYTAFSPLHPPISRESVSKLDNACIGNVPVKEQTASPKSPWGLILTKTKVYTLKHFSVFSFLIKNGKNA